MFLVMLHNDNLGKKVEPDLFGVLKSIDKQVNYCRSLLNTEIDKSPNTSFNAVGRVIDKSSTTTDRSR